MNDSGLGPVEAHFADLIWQHAPVASGVLVQLSAAEIGWKKSTTYTVLKKLCGRGLFTNEKGTVRVLVPREDFYAARSARFVKEHYSGSLPAFVAAFARQKALSAEDVAELRRIIDAYTGE